MYDLKDFDRRRLLQAGLAAAGLAPIRMAQARTTAHAPPAANAPFGPLKRFDARVLNIGYVEAGPADGDRY